MAAPESILSARFLLGRAVHAATASGDGVHAQLLHHPAGERFFQHAPGGTIGLGIAKLLRNNGAVADIKRNYSAQFQTTQHDSAETGLRRCALECGYK